MDLKCHVLLAAILTFLYVSTAFGLKCFDCNSEVNSNCIDLYTDGPQKVMNTTYLKDCPPEINGKSPFCRKMKYTIYGVEYYERVVRGCGWEEYKDRTNKCYNHNTDSKKEITCQCFDSECNTANTLTENPIFVLVLSLGLFVHALLCL